MNAIGNGATDQDISVADVARALGLPIYGTEPDHRIQCPAHHHEHDATRPLCGLGLGGKNPAVFKCLKCGMDGNAVTLVKLVLKCEAGKAIDWLCEHGFWKDEPEPTDPIDRLARRRRLSAEAARALGCEAQNDLVVFPMRNAEGTTVGQKQRRGDGRPFFVNGEEAKSYTRAGSCNGLFFVHPFPDTGDVLVCEGEIDTWAALSAGWPVVVGTAGITPGEVSLGELQRLVASRRGILCPHPGPESWKLKVGAALMHAGCEVVYVPPLDDDLEARLRSKPDRSAALRSLVSNAISLELQDEAPGPRDTGPRPLTDLGNAERFRKQHMGKVLFDVRLNCWRRYDRRRWVEDTMREVERLAQRTARSIYAEAQKAKDREVAEATIAWARKSESKDRLRAMVDIAGTLEGMIIPAENWDAHPALFNCLNGTVNLDAGELQDHRREDYLTKLAPVEFIKNASHPVWEKVIVDALPDEEARNFLCRLMGYGLYGLKYEKAVALVYGPHDTGKSTVIEAIQRATGDYQATVEPEVVMRRDFNGGSGPTPDIARLAGVRLAFISETNEGQKLNVGLVKRLSGGNARLSARICRGNTFEFDVTFLLVFQSNYRPVVPDDDTAFYTRAKVIPFENVVPADQIDPGFKKILEHDATAQSAILSWLVKGCLDWRHRGIGTSKSVQFATQAYAEAMNTLADFFSECCVFRSNYEVSSARLKASYDQWVTENRIRKPLSLKKFTEKLRLQNCHDERITSGPEKGKKKWVGIGLVSECGESSEVVLPNDFLASSHEEINRSKTSLTSLASPDGNLEVSEWVQ